MSGWARPLLARPIEVGTGDAWKCGVDVAGGTTYVYAYPTAGLYESLGTLLYELQAQVIAALSGTGYLAQGFLAWTTTQYVNCADSPLGTNARWLFGASLAPVLGVTTSALQCLPSWTAPNRSTHVWYSGRPSGSDSRWERRSRFAGSELQTGELSGLAVGDVIYDCDVLFDAVPARIARDCHSRGTAADWPTFETFIHGALEAAPSASTTGNPRGVWLFPDALDFGAADTHTGREGVQYEKTSTPDLCTWCSITEGRVRALTAQTVSGLATLYTCSLSLTACSAYPEGWL